MAEIDFADEEVVGEWVVELDLGEAVEWWVKDEVVKEWVVERDPVDEEAV